MSRPAVVELTGELTVQYAADHLPRLLSALEVEGQLRLRLAGVTELDTAGLQILLLLRREANRLGGAVEFVDASQAVQDTLAIVSLDGALRPMEDGFS